MSAQRSGDRCTCGHARQRHSYGRYSKRWGPCFAKVLGASGPGPHELCSCDRFELQRAAVLPAGQHAYADEYDTKTSFWGP